MKTKTLHYIKSINTAKCALAAALSLSLAMSMPGNAVLAASTASDNNASGSAKTESIYAKLGADGSASNAYVINDFELASATDIKDYGNYSEVKNLTDLTSLSQKGNSVSFSAEKGHFYYQGTLAEPKLPWNFNIRYELDGKEIAAEELGGKSGHLMIKLSTTQNPDVNNIFYENYVMQISLSLSSKNCTNIAAPDASIAAAGTDKTISFTLLPGTDADLTVEADVTDFSMSGVTIAAVPYSMNVDMGDFSTEDLTSQMSELTDAVSQLNDGARELSDGITQLSNGNSALQSGSAEIQSGLSALDDNASTLIDASSQIGNALDTISAQLSDADFSSMDSLAELPGALTQLADGLDQTQSGLMSLGDGLTFVYNTLSPAMENAAATLTSAPSDAELEALAAAATEPDAANAYRKLLASYQSLNIIVNTYQQIQPVFSSATAALNPENGESVTAGISAISQNLRMMSENMSGALSGTDIKGMMEQLQTGMERLSSNYSSFHQGLCSYTEGVTVLSTGYSQYQSGLNTYLDGVGQLSSGTVQLSDGMNELSDGVSTMPDEMQKQIDEMMEEYNSSDFDAVSFVDERNANIASVQFILSTESIDVAEENAEITEEKEEGVLDRIKNLFK